MRLFADTQTDYTSSGGFRCYVYSFVRIADAHLRQNEATPSGVPNASQSWERRGSRLLSRELLTPALIVGKPSHGRALDVCPAPRSFTSGQQARVGKLASIGARAMGTSKSESPLAMPVASLNTATSGNRPTGLSRRIGWSITSMGSRTTTVLKTSWGCLARITGRERTLIPLSMRPAFDTSKLVFASWRVANQEISKCLSTNVSLRAPQM